MPTNLPRQRKNKAQDEADARDLVLILGVILILNLVAGVTILLAASQDVMPVGGIFP